MMNKAFSIEQLINMNAIKYDRLVELCNEAFAGSNANELNIFIDMYSMIKVLYNEQLYTIDDYSLVTSSIINLISHYRHFFLSRYRVSTKFYIIWSENIPYINNQFIVGYNSHNRTAFESKIKTRSMIVNNLELLNTLCPYLPDIFFVNSTFETGVVIQDIIFKNKANGDNSPSAIITKDVYNYQLATQQEVTIFRPYKIKGEDCSYYINRNNVLAYFLADRKVILTEKETQGVILQPEILSLIMALSKVPERHIKSLLSTKVAIKVLCEMINNRLIMNGYNSDINIVYHALLSSKGYKKNISNLELMNRFKAIDIIFQQKIYMTTPESDFKPVNLYDPDSVRAINNKYFVKNPLDLNRL